MKKPSFIHPNNPVRAWSRRIVHGVRSRPDVQVMQLQRRLQVVESVLTISARFDPFIPEFIACLTPYQFPSLQLSRVGSAHDGGYALPMALLNRSQGIVSIGVGDNNDADVALAEMGLTIHAWDPTVQGLPTSHDRIVFHNVGVGDPTNGSDYLGLDDILVQSFGPSGSDLTLLMDAEGAEWHALSECSNSTLDRISLLAVELHDLGNLLIDPAPQLATLRRLNESFVPIAVHANNHGASWLLPGLVLPDALEVTYVRRESIDVLGTVGNCSAKVLAPCCPDLPEIPISWCDR